MEEKDVIVTKPFMSADWGIWALCYMQVCAHGEVPPERVEEVANLENPPGSSAPWSITSKGPEGTDLSPVQCLDDPARLHYMLSC
jgi:hypothetical protein